ncbi:MAG: hypothetical protein BroJett013_06710 [Alphaproteobacteria bacterium]|nr:MAG: hypothetical protein BroJett013_06710 [Alphaproteobacteria bacterium]
MTDTAEKTRTEKATEPAKRWFNIQICHICQRSVYFAGGFLELLVKKLRLQAHRAMPVKRKRTKEKD